MYDLLFITQVLKVIILRILIVYKASKVQNKYNAEYNPFINHPIMNPEGSQSFSKLLPAKSKYLKRFNSKINTSLIEPNAQTHQPSYHQHETSQLIKQRQQSPLKHKPIIDKYLSHIAFVQNKLEEQERLIDTLVKQNQHQSQLFDKLKKNYELLKQQNIQLEDKHFQIQSISKTQSQQLQMARNKIAIIEIQFQDKLNQTQHKLYEMKENSPIWTPFKRGRTRANDTNSASCSQIEIQSPNQNPQSKTEPKSGVNPVQKMNLSVGKINEILNSNTQSQKKYINLEISFQQKSNLCKKLQTETETLKEKINQLSKEQEQRKQELTKLKAALQQGNKKLKGEETLVTGLRAEIKRLEAKMEEKLREVQAQKNEKKQKVIELEKLQEQLNSIEQSNTITKKYYQQEIESLNDKIGQLAILIQEQPKRQRQFDHNQLLKKNQTIQQLEEDMEKLESQVKSLQIASQKKDLEFVQLNKLYETVTEQNDKLTKEKETINREKNTLQHLSQKKQNQLKDLKDKLTLAQSLIHFQQAKTTTVNQQKQTYKSQLVTLNSQIQSKQSQIKQIQTEVDSLRQKMGNKVIKLQKQKEQQDQKVKGWQKMETQVSEKRQEIQKLRQVIEKHRQQIQILRKRIDSHEQSHKRQLQIYKEQCSQVVSNLALQLQQLSSKFQQMTQSHTQLSTELQVLTQELAQKQVQNQQLKQQIQQLKQTLTQQKQLLQQQFKHEIATLHQDRQKMLDEISSYREIQMNQKEQEWKEKMELMEKQKLELIYELQTKIKEVEHKIQFMEEQAQIKQNQVIALINQKNSAIKNLQFTLLQQSQTLTEHQKTIQTLKNSLH